MKIQSRFTTAIATGAILLNVLAPVAFATDITVSGNGAQSESAVKVTTQNTNVVNQNNTANVQNNISSKSSTGGNNANNNTNGDVTVKTGAAKSDTTVVNNLNTNSATVSNCGTCGGSANVTIGGDTASDGNGAHSDNKVTIDNSSINHVTQTNTANVLNTVDAKAKTGKNDANFNTGGDVTVDTGAATTSVSVGTTANRNLATIGGGNGTGDGSSVAISHNGAFSENKVKLSDYSAVVLTQDNNANVANDVDAKADTGKNDAKFNTGGDVSITTDDAKTDVDVKNQVNFNAADVDCGCLLEDLTVSVADNGADSENKVKANDASDLFVFADNAAELSNDVDGNATSGKNDANLNTGDSSAVDAGAATSSTDVENTGNINLFNQGASIHVPGDWDVNVDFDLSDLLAFLHVG
jgi:hypothetical protein